MLEAAADHFGRLGFDATSLDDVIAASKTSKGTLYHHFEGKEDLYATVLERMLERMWAAILPHVSLDEATRATFWDIVARAWGLGAQYLVARPVELRLWRDFQEQWRSLPDAGPTRRVRERSLSSGILMAKRGQELGCVRTDLSPEDCAELGEVLDIVTDDWFYRIAKQHGNHEAIRRCGPSTVELMWRILAPLDALGSGPPHVGVTDPGSGP